MRSSFPRFLDEGELFASTDSDHLGISSVIIIVEIDRRLLRDDKIRDFLPSSSLSVGAAAAAYDQNSMSPSLTNADMPDRSSCLLTQMVLPGTPVEYSKQPQVVRDNSRYHPEIR